MDTDTDTDGNGYADVPTRPMRVKVLYSFDQDNKTNCLARLPNTLQIPAVAINETAQVGVIDLQQCIHAVTSASPEVVSRLSEGDFTVYAYDYSEEDTPLVGQGMLSTALAAARAGTDSDKAMITGRVCKNMQALFSNGVKETLEVKLRLVPVPKPAVSAMAKSSSPATTAGFDPNAWNSSLQQNRLQQQMNSYFDFDPSHFMSDADQFSDAMMSSPEDGSPNNSLAAEGTPQDIPSSPPILMGVNYAQPSSPGLPVFPSARPLDSGYMSEPRLNTSNLTDGFDYDDENRSPDAEDHEIAAHYHARNSTVQPSSRSGDASSRMLPTYPSNGLTSDMNVSLEVPGDMGQLPQKMLINVGPGRYRQEVQGPKQPQPQPSDARPAMAPSRRSSLALPPNALLPPPAEQGQSANEGARKRPAVKRKYTKRVRVDGAGSDAGSPAPSDTEGTEPKRSGSGAQRRVIIQKRLEAALANNQMPQHCIHCGAIETPTWRKLYVKYFNGKPSPLDSCEGEGETVGVESVTQDPVTNEITRYVIRKTMKKTRDSTPGEGFQPVTVCNPCGLWFNKFRNGASGDGPVTDDVEPQSDAFFFTDQAGPDDAADDEAGGDIAQVVGPAAVAQTQRPDIARPRANSLQPLSRRRSGGGMNASQLDAALTRAVQSSPVPFRGSQQSPIEISDITPKPTRRLLFPSPRRDGEVKSLDDNGQASLNATPPAGKGFTSRPASSLKVGVPVEDTNVNVFDAFLFDKENMEPGLELDDDLMHLFEGSPTAMFKTPRKTPGKAGTTPLLQQRQLDHLLKTPTPASRKRKPLSPNPNAANNATAVMNDFMTSPSSSRYFLRSTPSRQDRTPARASQTTAANEMTPFSRHIAQMLSEASESATGVAFPSPSRALDFSDLPAFSTPGKTLADMDWSGMEDILSSEFAAFDGGEGDGGKDGGATGQQGVPGSEE
ncbi:hypothetical protein B0A55_07471 [Friedmanniomyces simplex]|uniref:Ams2/SPT21 N-terminal domain-containing protein n=1 Tax=Friedmanniomyces simplex TaxID=329884 RepID=A0A4U0WZM8_9PEZI|nr:hypothetical protein B0A55_07471 [Friedmanniomyces simplex]